MSQGEYIYKSPIREPDWVSFKGINTIIPNEGKSRFFDIKEVEVYKISI